MRADAQSEVREKLEELCSLVAQEAMQRDVNGLLAKDSELWEKLTADRIVHFNGHAIVKPSRCHFNRLVWHSDSRKAFLRDFLKEHTELAQLLLLLEQEGVERKPASALIERLLDDTANKAVDSGAMPTQIELNEATDTMMRRLLKEPITALVKAYMIGLWLETEDVLQVDPRVSFRRIEAADYESVGPVGRSQLVDEFLQHYVTAILEIRAPFPRGCQPQIALNTVVDLMRLYKVGSISCVRCSTTPMVGFGACVFPRVPPPHLTYPLGQDDIQPLQQLFRRTQEPLGECYKRLEGGGVSLSQDGTVLDEKGPVAIAMARYREALLNVASVEQRIVNATSCLEALLLKSNERGALKRSLSQRLAVLLSCVGEQPHVVMERSSKAYRIRSNYVHGEAIRKSDEKAAKDLAGLFFDYARKTLLLFLQLGALETAAKETLVEQLDDAMIDSAIKKKLEEKCVEHTAVT